MRGCLFSAGLGVVVLAALLWFAAPILATTVVQASLTTAGFGSDPAPEVELELSSPLDLLDGRVGGIRVSGAGSLSDGLAWRAADIALDDVDLFDRTFRSVEMTLTDPVLSGTTGETMLIARTLQASGPAADVEVRLTVPGPAFVEGFRPALRSFGIDGSLVTVQAPNLVVQNDPRFPVALALVVRDGGIVAVPQLGGLPTVELYRPAVGLPFRLTSVGVVGQDLVIDGVLDLAGWLE